MTYGVTNSGFVKKDLNTILEDNRTRLKDSFGSNIDLSDESPLGMINNIFSFQASLLWELGEGIYNSQYQKYAEGVPLDNAMSSTSNTRFNAIKSTVDVVITGIVGTLINAGFRASVAGNSSAIFETLSNITIGSGGTASITMQATEFGAIEATSGTLNVIETPIYGVTSLTNASDAVVGRNAETDAEFKLRAKNQKQKSGTSPVEGIRKAILDLDNIVQCIVNENNTDVIDSDGRPPHCVEAVVQGGDEDEIAKAMFASKAGGIQTYGSVTRTVIDNQGISRNINFNRPASKTIYVIVNITKNTNINDGALYPADGDQQIKDAIVLWGADFLIGQDVLRDGANGIINPINSIAGIRAVEVLFGLTNPPTAYTPVTIANNELASFSEINITVNS